jgi:hypothetical protein
LSPGSFRDFMKFATPFPQVIEVSL